MDLKTIHTDRQEAFDKWKAYLKAFKQNPTSMNKDMVNIYREAKQGHKIIDIADVIKAGGNRWEQDKDGGNHVYPNLAIAKATAKEVHCKYFTDGRVQYQHKEFWGSASKFDLPVCLPTFLLNGNRWGSLEFKAPVPKIPSIIWDKPLYPYHYILWHVDKWEMVPSEDPALLKRITKNLFVVLKTWDLTPLELAVMKNYI